MSVWINNKDNDYPPVSCLYIISGEVTVEGLTEEYIISLVACTCALN